MIALPQLISENIPIAKNDRRIAKSMSGLGIAAIEAFILCPVERLKVYMMTNSSEGSGTLLLKL